MKRGLTMLMILLTLVFLAGCSLAAQEQTTQTDKTVKLVDVITVQEECLPIAFNYVGITSSEQIKKYGFKFGGKISSIFVQPGDRVTLGDKLVRLNTGDLNLALDAARAQFKAAEAQYEKALNGASKDDIHMAELSVQKAQAGYDFAFDNCEKVKRLFDKEAISKQVVEQAELEMSLREKDLSLAQTMLEQVIEGVREEDLKALEAQLEQATVNLKQKKDMLADAIMKADFEGYVVDVISEEGELVGAGIPVVIVRALTQIVDVGVTQKDVVKMKVGNEALVTVEEQEVSGTVIEISQVPDIITHTYNVKIALEECQLFVGSIARASILVGEEEGVWIPITCIQSGGSDYVYVVENGLAARKNVVLGNVRGNRVRVEGLSGGDMLVVNGMNKLTPGVNADIRLLDGKEDVPTTSTTLNEETVISTR